MELLARTSFVILLAVLPATTVAEDKKELRVVEENAFKAFLNQHLTHSLNLFAMQQNAAAKEATVEIKPALLTHLEKPEKPIEKPQQIDKQPVNFPFNPFYPNFPFLPALPQLPAQYWSYYASRPEQYSHLKPELLSHNRPISAPSKPYYTSDLFYGMQNPAFFGGYPSFIVINPGNFAPYFGGYHNNTPIVAGNTPISLLNPHGVMAPMQPLLTMPQSESIAAMDRQASPDTESSTQAEAHMEPIFLTAPDTVDDDTMSDEALMEQARASPTKNALLEIFLKANQRKQLQEGIAAIYLRNFNMNKK